MWSGETVKWIDIELTSFCNIKCPGCFRQVKKKKVENILDKDFLSFNQLKKWITSKNFPNLTLLNFCGSIDEPTLHPELLDIVSHFNQFSEINIATNGSTKTIKFWQKLGEEKISVFFGLDGIDQKSIEKYRVGSRFDRIIKNWRAFIKSGGKATWQFIAFDHNEHLIDEAKKIAKNEGFENFRLIYSHRNENQESKKKQRSEEKRIVCKYAEQDRIFISHTGVALPCCFLNSEFLQSYATNEQFTDFQHLYKYTGEMLTNSIRYNQPDEIFEGDLFSSIINSWNKNPISRCWTTCKQSKQDVFIGEKLQ